MNAIRIDDRDSDYSTEIDQMMPVASISRQARSLDAKHSPTAPVQTLATSF
jgi:hypothetical protein